MKTRMVALIPRFRNRSMPTCPTRRLWWQWLGVNAVGEALGLGAIPLLIGLMAGHANQSSLLATLAIALMIIAGGALIEGGLVGVLQWQVIQQRLPMPRSVWMRATIIGAGIAWVLGMLPSISMDMTASATTQPVVEPPQLLVLGLAAGLGMVGGVILAFPQWLALRSYAPQARWWIPANALAWMLGMPLIFASIDVVMGLASMPLMVVVGGGLLMFVGAVVGGIHGVAMVAILNSRSTSTTMSG